MDEITFEKIEQYLNNELSNEEKKIFESELAGKEELASMVKLYSTIDGEMRNSFQNSEEELALKTTLQDLNNIYFKSQIQNEEIRAAAIVKKTNWLRFTPYALAASIIIAIAIFFLNKSTPQQLSKDYIAQNFSTLSSKMEAGTTDTLQQGIAAYNSNHYDSALMLFKRYDNNYPENNYAKQYIGITYLIIKDYAEAVKAFDELSKMKGLYSNPGLFLKALTLLQRNKEGDKEQAKQLLQQVVEQKLEGDKEAEELLKSFETYFFLQ
jgi:TolA-binding protein